MPSDTNINNLPEMSWADLYALWQILREATGIEVDEWKRGVGNEISRRMQLAPRTR